MENDRREAKEVASGLTEGLPGQDEDFGHYSK